MKKTFITLAWVVGFVILAGFALNILMPNVTRQVANQTERMLYKATGMAFDFNGDGSAVDSDVTNTTDDVVDNGQDGAASGGVEGFGQGSTGN